MRIKLKRCKFTKFSCEYLSLFLVQISFFTFTSMRCWPDCVHSNVIIICLFGVCT